MQMAAERVRQAGLEIKGSETLDYGCPGMSTDSLDGSLKQRWIALTSSAMTSPFSQYCITLNNVNRILDRYL